MQLKPKLPMKSEVHCAPQSNPHIMPALHIVCCFGPQFPHNRTIVWNLVCLTLFSLFLLSTSLQTSAHNWTWLTYVHSSLTFWWAISFFVHALKSLLHAASNPFHPMLAVIISLKGGPVQRFIVLTRLMIVVRCITLHFASFWSRLASKRTYSKLVHSEDVQSQPHLERWRQATVWNIDLDWFNSLFDCWTPTCLVLESHLNLVLHWMTHIPFHCTSPLTSHASDLPHQSAQVCPIQFNRCTVSRHNDLSSNASSHAMLNVQECNSFVALDGEWSHLLLQMCRLWCFTCNV